MRYVSENHEVVVNAQGGYAALGRLGFKLENREGEVSKKKTKDKAAPVKVEKSETKGQSRNQLMAEVQRRGIKNFRVMNKEELEMIVGGAPVAQIEAIQLAAVTRWKSGWGKKKK